MADRFVSPSSDKEQLDSFIVKTLDGKNLQFVLPAQNKSESDEGFAFRKSQAESLAGAYQVGAEMVEQIMSSGQATTTDEAIMLAVQDVQGSIDNAQAMKDMLQRLPENSRNKGVRDRNTLDLMKTSAQKANLLKFLQLHPNSVEFENEGGETGLSFHLDSGGNVRSQSDPTLVPAET